MSAFRSVPGTVRWLHTYLSLVGFASILFFGVTGLTLNHARYFESDEPLMRKLEGTLDAGLLSEGAVADRLAIVEALRERHELRGAVHEFEVDDSRLSIVFKGPSYSADVDVERANGHYEIREERFGAMALLDDLHKGRDSGASWSVVIDIAAVLTSLSALTGLWLVLYVRRRRNAGLLVATIGAVVCLAVWLLGVA